MISAGLSVTGTFPFVSAHVVGVPLPGTVPLASSVITNTVPANSATPSLLVQSSSLSQNSSAIVQKLTQVSFKHNFLLDTGFLYKCCCFLLCY